MKHKWKGGVGRTFSAYKLGISVQGPFSHPLLPNFGIQNSGLELSWIKTVTTIKSVMSRTREEAIWLIIGFNLS